MGVGVGRAYLTVLLGHALGRSGAVPSHVPVSGAPGEYDEWESHEEAESH